jgi:hypothetical protein
VRSVELHAEKLLRRYSIRFCLQLVGIITVCG